MDKSEIYLIMLAALKNQLKSNRMVLRAAFPEMKDEIDEIIIELLDKVLTIEKK